MSGRALSGSGQGVVCRRSMPLAAQRAARARGAACRSFRPLPVVCCSAVASRLGSLHVAPHWCRRAPATGPSSFTWMSCLCLPLCEQLVRLMAGERKLPVEEWLFCRSAARELQTSCVERALTYQFGGGVAAQCTGWRDILWWRTTQTLGAYGRGGWPLAASCGEVGAQPWGLPRRVSWAPLTDTPPMGTWRKSTREFFVCCSCSSCSVERAQLQC